MANTACDAGGICTEEGTELSLVPATRTVSGFADTTPRLKMNDASASESAQGINFVVRLDPPHDATVTVNYATTNGTATAGNDYTAASGTLSFAAWETEKVLQVPIIGDETDEPDETLTISLSDAAGGAEIQRGTATGSILDDDEPSDTVLTANFENVPADHDGETSFSFNVSFTTNVAIGYAAMRDNAFTVTEGDVTAARQVNGQSDRWRITVEPDGSEDVTITLPRNRACTTTGAICSKGDDPVQLSNSPSSTVAGPTETVVTATPTVSIADGSGTESDDTSITFTVTLDEAASGTVSVDYATSDGTANAGDDYTSKNGTLTFNAGTTSKTISVAIADDSEEESDETFTVTLSNASGADLGTSSATGTIRNRLVVIPNVSISGGSGKEGDDSSIAFTVTLDQAGTGTVSVDYATSDGSAEAGNDYTSTSGRLSFTTGTTTQNISVPIEDDIENESDETFTVTLSNPSGADLGTSSATGTIRNRYVAPLTARFENMPSEHDGNEFTFDLHFSESPEVPYRRLRDRSFTLVQADVIRAQRQNPQATNKNQSWTITVEPLGTGQIGITLPAAVNCTDDKSICTGDGRKLSHSTSATVAGPPSISVADATVTEAAGAMLAFTVSLNRSSGSNVSVDYATSDGTATAGADYTATSGTLTIRAGSTSATVDVTVLDDLHDDGGETLTLTLSNASNGVLDDSTATGTIENSDPLPKALIARFGRTAAVHVVEQVEERVNAPRAPGFDGSIDGRRIDRNMGRDFALELLRGVAGSAGQSPGGLQGVTGNAPGGQVGTVYGPDGGPGGLGAPTALGSLSSFGGFGGALSPGGLGSSASNGFGSRLGGVSFGGRDQLLGGSSFALNRETRSGRLSFWSRSASSSFTSREDLLALNGDVRTTMFGADYARGRMVTGVSLSHSRSVGSYAGPDTGQVTSAVTGLYPWIGFKASERVTLWTVAGYGAGGLMLQPGAGAPIETGLSMVMAAGGGRGQILGGGEGFGLAFKADALWVGMRTEAGSGPGGSLKATRAAVTRLRTALEGSRNVTVANRLALTPSIELGVRQDGGDADVGAGLDLAAGLVLADSVTGLAVDLRVRRLLIHQAGGFAESGMAVSVSYDPSPSTPLGFTARIAPAWGGDAMSGAEALWGRDTMGGMGMAGGPLLESGGTRLDTEVGYGLPMGSRFVGTPRVGLRTSEYGRDYRVGYGIGVLEQGPLRLQLGVEAERRVSPIFGLLGEAGGGRDQRVVGQASVEW